MKIYRFDAHVGRSMDLFGSQSLSMANVIGLDGEVRVGALHLGPNGELGYHEAASPQLLLVVDGVGWIRADGGVRTRVEPGHAAHFKAGEWYAAGSDDNGMVAILIEAHRLRPEDFMPMVGVQTRWNAPASVDSKGASNPESSDVASSDATSSDPASSDPASSSDDS